VEKTRTHSKLKPSRDQSANLILDLLQRKQTEAITERIIKNPKLVQELEEGLHSASPEVKFGSAKALRTISERCPEILYHDWSFFVNLLDSENNILKWNAMDIIANLTKVDAQDRFSRLFRKFFGLLHEGSLITAGHVVDNSGKIALSKPEFKEKIIEELLTVETIRLPTDECSNILIGKAISAFQILCGEKADKRVVSFVKRQLRNPRHATKVKAERFLKRTNLE